jgi:hypothetical protein
VTATADRPDDRGRRHLTHSALMIATTTTLDQLERDIARAKRAGNEGLASRLADRALRVAGY